jgi:hypothetical protein
VAVNEQVAVSQTAARTSQQTRRFERLRAVLLALGKVGPFGVTFATYSLLIDHLANSWFKVPLLRYAFAAACATLVGLVVMMFFQRPAVQRALAPVGPPPAVLVVTEPPATLPAASRPAPYTVHELRAGTRSRLLADLRDGVKGAVQLRGWSQFLGDRAAPSAIGSSYGLRLAQLLDLRDPALDRARIVNSVLALQRPGGGWAARSQRGDAGRPEVTAWVLPALVRAGLPAADRAPLVARLEQLIDPEHDAGLSRTTVVTASLSALAELAPDSAMVDVLLEMVETGVQIPSGASLAAWARSVSGRRTEPSVPHTARVVVALRRLAAARPSKASTAHELAEAGTAWLRANADFELDDEQVRRPAGEATDVLVVGHFTPAWVAKALMYADNEADLDLLRRVVRRILDLQRNGVWRWRQTDLEPIWMSYQAMAVLTEYCLRNLPWPA